MIMDLEPSPSLINILEMIRIRPTLYVGPDGDRTVQLNNLQALISGYYFAVYQHQLRDHGTEEYAMFGPYLDERFGWSPGRDPIDAIREAAASDVEAWDDFWRLLRDFRDAQKQMQSQDDGSPP